MFSKLLTCSQEQTLQLIVRPEREGLTTQLTSLASDELSEHCFIEQALEELKVRETDLTSHGIQEDMDKMVSGQSSPLSPSLFLSTLLLGLIWTRDQIHCMWLCACLQVCRTNLLSHLVSGWLSLMATWRETLPLPSLASRTEEKRREREERVDQHPPVCLKILWSQNKLMTR
jgi:hypothetical protein